MNSRFCSSGKLLSDLLYFSLLLILLWCWKPAVGQDVINAKPLGLGDRVPDVTIQNILRYKTKSAKISDFKGKLLILDFWATWCQPCVGMIPRMDSLEKRFAGKVLILPVTYQTEREVTVFREKYAKRTGLRIQVPEVVSDTVLKKLFLHSAVPHYVWIDQNGIVKAFTGREEITAEKIQKFLLDQNTQLTLKKDQVRLGYKSYTTSLFDFIGRSKGLDLKSKYHMLYSEYIPGISGQISLIQPGDSLDHWRITFTNVSPKDFYLFAYGQGRRFLARSTVQIKTKDSLKFDPGVSGAAAREWVTKNTFCYELVLPAQQAENAFEVFQNDLARIYPQYEAVVEKKQMIVLALVRTSSQQKFKASDSSLAFKSAYDGFSFHLRGSTMAGFVQGLNNLRMNHSKHPLVDHTGYAGMVDLDMELDFDDLTSVRTALAKYDLALVEKQMPVDVLVVQDRTRKVSASIR